MLGLLHFVQAILVLPFRSKGRLEAENAVLRHQLIVLRRKLGGRVRLTNSDRWFLIRMYCGLRTMIILCASANAASVHHSRAHSSRVDLKLRCCTGGVLAASASGSQR